MMCEDPEDHKFIRTVGYRRKCVNWNRKQDEVNMNETLVMSGR